MKKQSKNFFVIIGCMFALGILLCTVGTILGGSLSEASIARDESSLKSINKTMENAAEIQNLSLHLSASDVVLKEGSTFSIQGKGINRCEIKNGTWHVTSKLKKGFHLFSFFPFNIGELFSERKVTITLPTACALKKISLDAKAIDCKIDKLNCETLDIDVAAGSIKIEELNSDEADISVSAGDIKIKTFQIRGEAEIDCNMGDIKLGSDSTRAENLCNKLDANCNMGDVKYYGKLTGENDVNVTMGSIKLSLTGTARQYNFSTDSTLGSVSSQDRERDSDQEAPLYGTGNLSCTMGDISVSYHDM